RYRTYYLDDDRKNASNKGKLKSSEGSTQIASLKNSAKFDFETTPVELSDSELKADWFDGKKSKAHDSIAGIWIRVMKDGEVVNEYTEPSGLKAKAEWK